MRFQVKKGPFYRALNIAGRTAESKASIKSLDRIRLRVGEDLEILSTDGTVFTRCRVPLEGEAEQGDTLVLGKLLVSIISSLPSREDDLIQISQEDGGKISITSGKVTHELNTFSAETFLPFLEVDTSKHSIEIKPTDLAIALGQVTPCVSRNSTKPQYTGVYIEVDPSGLILAATDSSRFAYRFLETPVKGLQKGLSVVAPLKFLEDLKKLLETEKAARILLTEKFIGYVGESIVMVSRLLNVDFPNFKEILPREFGSGFSTVEVAAFRGAVKSLMPLAHESNMIAIMKVSGGAITLTSVSEQSGKSRAEVPFRQDCPDLEMMFNIGFILDGINGIETDNFEIRLTSSVEPAVLKMEERGDYLYILMPMRL